MQAVSVSRDLRDKYDRIIRAGEEQYRLAGYYADTTRRTHLLNALVAFAQAWAIADTACTIGPANHYGAWATRRGHAGGWQSTARAGLG